jgi:Skp family chaperone for outer membrane proteins
MLPRLFRSLALVLALIPQTVSAQGLPRLAPIATLDQERLFDDTRYGRALQAVLEREADALASENRRIEAQLESEERELTARRPGLPADEFRKLADQFDAKAEETRETQAEKLRALDKRGVALRQGFIERSRPILAQLMLDRGAVAVIAKNAVLLAFDSIDLTDEAITRLDEALGDGSGPRAGVGPLVRKPENSPALRPPAELGTGVGKSSAQPGP